MVKTKRQDTKTRSPLKYIVIGLFGVLLLGSIISVTLWSWSGQELSKKISTLNTLPPTPTKYVYKEPYFSGKFLISFSKIIQDFRSYPSSVITFDSSITDSNHQSHYVVKAGLQFDYDVVKDLTFRKKVDKYFTGQKHIDGYIEDVREIYGIKCYLYKNGKDAYIEENYTSLSITCFDTRAPDR